MIYKEISNDYIAGFVDGEGCFALKYRKDRKVNKDGKTSREYYYWNAEFAIVLHPQDAELLKSIQKRLGIGKISYKKTGDQVRFSVQNTTDLYTVIVPFFKKNHLWGIKGKDFALWSKAVGIIAQHKKRTVQGYSNPMSVKDQEELEGLKKQIDKLKRKVIVP